MVLMPSHLNQIIYSLLYVLFQGAVKVMAKDLIRTRHQITKFYALKSQLQGVALRIQVIFTFLQTNVSKKRKSACNVFFYYYYYLLFILFYFFANFSISNFTQSCSYYLLLMLNCFIHSDFFYGVLMSQRPLFMILYR